MKKLIIATCALLCATALVVQAQDAAPKKAKKELTAEQKQVQKDMVAKYDTNKDGKLDMKKRPRCPPKTKPLGRRRSRKWAARRKPMPRLKRRRLMLRNNLV